VSLTFLSPHFFLFLFSLFRFFPFPACPTTNIFLFHFLLVSECALAASLWSSSSSSCPFLLFSSSVCGFVLRTWRLVLLRYFLIVCRTHTRREERDANTRRRRRMPEGTTGGDPSLPNEGARDPLQLVTSHLSFPIFSREVSLTCERSLSSCPALLLPAHFSSPVFGQAAAWQRTK